MKSIICKQERALKGKIVSFIVLVFSVLYLLVISEPLLSRLLLFTISIVVFGFSVSYKINSDFNNQKLFSVFDIILFKTKLDLDFPDYVSVFSASFKLDNDWGAIGALGTKEKHDKIVVRFFTGNKNFTLYKTNKYEEAVNKANALSELLNVEVYDATKE
ncbi:hypothetical protein U6A24_20065 [Aquimarina gracilis]|uniref:PH (Pleckstrin Homology) domain-containing protein n=1 Tax=Aquimarina gracilis TaxID=874422 RepID=A0ABU6A0V7_9FLAO|nr:hypothetical protein [Aquimarina gracilis]MEB3347784.1 hypothetical protein [Aquimarina gracilis]